MKAMILAAGRGERMRPLTDTLPKPLLPVAGKPLIVHHLEALALQGITEIVINCAWLADTLMATLGDGSRYGVSIRYSQEHTALETGGGIVQALPWLGDEPFVVINGDVLLSQWPDVKAITLAEGCLGHLWLVTNPSHHTAGDFALNAEALVYQAQDGEQTMTFSGMAVYHPSLFAAAPTGAFALGPWLRQAMAQGHIQGEFWPHYWCDVGTVARLEQANIDLSQQQ
ncbi:N-acetylmuramate alpha-1-phosphate uridylyltransferase MurU [Shewanella sp. NIFS-20-20]|uniref:N-acetylmuramate alpha-1-phosphate uridylyltransferase MurU n=1 Tax=Shewanella sp. NIFS-20-20 TaxID=2853806 RepID=UPI001C444303|nr:nucleotidyltransferase family protein [Shewanella sp. NIFS-20-20]MBV7314437.1 nucleotidyltransferase family protein [Shewanella sp. NIFS-20-20]